MKEKQIIPIWAMNSHTYTEQPRIHYDDFLCGIQIGKAKYNKLQDLASMPQEAEQPKVTQVMGMILKILHTKMKIMKAIAEMKVRLSKFTER